MLNASLFLFQNSIRHNLSLYNIFEREPAKRHGSYWTIKSNVEPKMKHYPREKHSSDKGISICKMKFKTKCFRKNIMIKFVTFSCSSEHLLHVPYPVMAKCHLSIFNLENPNFLWLDVLPSLMIDRIRIMTSMIVKYKVENYTS